MFATLIVLTLATSAPSAAEPELIRGPVAMTPAQIREYNSKLPSDHPNYIRCERKAETGSLVRRRPVCRTNEEWSRLEENGNRDAREAVEGLQKGWSNGNPPTMGT